MAKGFDSDTPLTATVIQQAKAAGFVAAGRYLKNLGVAEVTLCRENDFGLWLISEGMGDQATVRRGRAGGANDGVIAAHQATILFGAPSSVPIASAVDFDAGPDDVPFIDAYMGGFAMAIAPHPLLVYGDGAVLTSDLPAGTRAYVVGATGWEGTQAYLAKNKAPALVQHGEVALFGISVDLVDINDGSILWYPGRDPDGTPLPLPAVPNVSLSMPSLKALQGALISAGYDLGTTGADGLWGAHTAAALASYYGANA